MSDFRDTELVYREVDKHRSGEFEDCVRFAEGMLEEIVASEDQVEGFSPFSVQSAQDLVAYGFIDFDNDPPATDTDPHRDPVLVFYLNDRPSFQSQAYGVRQSYPFTAKHVGIFDGYAPNPLESNDPVPMVLSKENITGDVKRQKAEHTKYGTNIRYLKVHDVLSLMRTLRDQGVQSMGDLQQLYFHTRMTLEKQGIEIQKADHEAKKQLKEMLLAPPGE